jgi:hypothetical protein
MVSRATSLRRKRANRYNKSLCADGGAALPYFLKPTKQLHNALTTSRVQGHSGLKKFYLARAVYLLKKKGSAEAQAYVEKKGNNVRRRLRRRVAKGGHQTVKQYRAARRARRGGDAYYGG